LSARWPQAVLKPFPHVVIDNFLDEDFAEEAWQRCASCRKRFRLDKFGRNYAGITDSVLTRVLSAKPFLSKLAKSFAISYKLEMPPESLPVFAMSPKNGKALKAHTDFKGKRAIVAMLYLNKRWSPGLGGELVLGNVAGKVTPGSVKYMPIWNRFVAFRLSRNSWHQVEVAYRNRFAILMYFEPRS
jgi:hypothetical protein